MSFARTQADGVWLGGSYVPGAADWQSLSTKIFQAANGTRGGAYAPTAAVVFAAGGFNVSGLTRIAYGGELETDLVTFPGLTNWPKYADGHEFQKRTIVQSMLTRQSTPSEHWTADNTTGAIQSLSIGIQPTDRSRVIMPARMRVELDVHDSATLKTVIFTFSVPVLRGAAPFAMPKFRIVRVDTVGRVTLLASVAAGADANGWRSPERVVSPERWYNAGLAQTFSYECDQNHVIDVSTYAYYAEIVEEAVSSQPIAPALLDGVMMREQKIEVDRATTAPFAGAPTGSISIDGSAPAANTRVLIKNGVLGSEDNAYGNGIWVVNTGGAWNRSSDLDDIVEFTRGAFVYVKAGNQNKGTIWQLAPPHPTKIPYPTGSGASDPEARIKFERFTPTGNKYHSLSMKFEGITEMRWQ